MDATAIVVAYVLVSIGVIIAFLLALRGRMVHRSAAPAPPRRARPAVLCCPGLMGPRIQRWDPWLVVEQTTLLRRGTLHERTFSH